MEAIWTELAALGGVILIDVALAADNAVVVGLAAAGLPAHQRRNAILIGIAAAAGLRIVFALIATQLLDLGWGLLVAGGLLVPCTANAAGLNTNLVVNGDFENVNLNITGEYHGPLVLNWTGPNLYAYSHDHSVTATSGPGGVPDYADPQPAGVGDPPGAGHWYFTPNNTNTAAFTDVHDPNVYYQDIDVSTGGTATAIGLGSATYSLSAWMSSYLNDGDYGHVRAEFRNSLNATIGTAEISDILDSGPNNVWNLTSMTGPVPVGTTSIRMSLFGTKVGGSATGGADGYTDNIDFRILGVPEPSSVVLVGLGVAAGLSQRRRRKES